MKLLACACFAWLVACDAGELPGGGPPAAAPIAQRTQIDAAAIANPDATIPEPPEQETDACTSEQLPAAFASNNDGIRPVFGRALDADCELVDLDARPPCEVECSVRTIESETSFRVIEDTSFYTAKPVHQIGHVVTYDGALDALSQRMYAMRARSLFVDPSARTIEVRPALCLFDCRTNGANDAACRARCPRDALYRYDGKRLRLAR